MTDKTDLEGGVIDELTPAELKALSKALKRIETDIFTKVLKRVSVLLIILVSLIFVGGVVNLTSCSTNIQSTASQQLANDPVLRDQIIAKAQGDFKDTQEKLKGLNQQIAEFEKQNARAAATFLEDLEQIRFMIGRISDELSRHLPPDDNKQASTGKAKK